MHDKDRHNSGPRYCTTDNEGVNLAVTLKTRSSGSQAGTGKIGVIARSIEGEQPSSKRIRGTPLETDDLGHSTHFAVAQNSRKASLECPTQQSQVTYNFTN